MAAFRHKEFNNENFPACVDAQVIAGRLETKYGDELEYALRHNLQVDDLPFGTMLEVDWDIRHVLDEFKNYLDSPPVMISIAQTLPSWQKAHDACDSIDDKFDEDIRYGAAQHDGIDQGMYIALTDLREMLGEIRSYVANSNQDININGV